MNNAAKGTRDEANKKHRASGTGSIRTRGDTYSALWTFTDPATGKRRQGSKAGFKTKKAAQEHLTTVLSKLQDGSWRPDSVLTVGALLDDWLAAKESEGVRVGTVSIYRHTVNGWIRPHIGALRLEQLTPARAQELVEVLRSPSGSRLRAKPLAARSIQHAMTALKAATRWAHETERISRDPLAGYRRPKAPPSSAATSAWSPEEARAFLTFTRDDRLSAAWWLMLGRGLRRGEVCGLRWSDVDLDSGALRVVGTRVVVDAVAMSSIPKTLAGRRNIPLDSHLVGILRSHRTRQREERLRAGDAWEETGFIFVNEIGQPHRPEHLSKRFKKLVSEAGVRPIRLHDLRHSAASIMLADGTPVKVVSEMFGHSNPTITMTVYQHVIPAMGKEAGARLTGMLVEGRRPSDLAITGEDDVPVSADIPLTLGRTGTEAGSANQI